MCNFISTEGNTGYDPWDSILYVLIGQKFRNLEIVEWLSNAGSRTRKGERCTGENVRCQYSIVRTWNICSQNI